VVPAGETPGGRHRSQASLRGVGLFRVVALRNFSRLSVFESTYRSRRSAVAVVRRLNPIPSPARNRLREL
jgi:hypothetical protein